MSRHQVIKLANKFSKKYNISSAISKFSKEDNDKSQKAAEILGVDPNASKEEIYKKYKLIMENLESDPDSDTDLIIEVESALRTLLKINNPNIDNYENYINKNDEPMDEEKVLWNDFQKEEGLSEKEWKEFTQTLSPAERIYFGL